MMCKAKVAVCSDIRTKHTTQSESHVEFLNVKTWRYVKKPLGFKRLMLAGQKLHHYRPVRSLKVTVETSTKPFFPENNVFQEHSRVFKYSKLPLCMAL